MCKLKATGRLSLLAALVLLFAFGDALQAQSAERESRFPEVADDVRSLGFHKGAKWWRNRVSGTTPKSESVRAYRAWLKRHSLPETDDSATAFDAYIAGDYKLADRIFAELSGRLGELPDDSESKTRYPQVAAEVRAFGVRDKRSLNIWPHCDPGPYDPSPCDEALRSWHSWTDRHGLPQNTKSAAAFKAFVLEDYSNADRHYADLKGHTKAAYDNIARDVRTLGIRQYDGRKESCENHFFSANPCPDAVRHWEAWAARHGLPLDYRSASTFQAYIEGDDARGHVQFALAKGHPVPEFYEGPGNRVVALGLRMPGGREQERCVNNYFAPNPCPRAIRLWTQWAEREGLPLDYESAAAFQAYINHDFRTGDRLYARAKGLPDPDAYAGPGLDIVAHWVVFTSKALRQRDCYDNYFSYNPCRGSTRLWRTWAAENDLALDPESAAIFEAYANYDFARGDRLFAAARGISVERLLLEYQGKEVPPEGDPGKLIIDVYPIN